MTARRHCAGLPFSFLLVPLFLLTACSSTPRNPEAPPIPPSLGRVDFPTYERKVLQNGLTVYALEYHEQPIVAVRLMITAGAHHDPVALPGVAAFTADLLNKGTTTRSATQIAEAVDYVGGSLEAAADMESTNITARSL